MGTVSQKLEYLNTTKGKIKDSINLTGAGITNNDTFRSYAVKLRDGLVQVLNDNGETLYNNFPKVSGSGSEITLENTLEAPMKNGTIDGDTLQNGTPTPDTPVEIQSVEGIQNITISDGTDSDSYEVNLEGKNLYNTQQFNDNFNQTTYKELSDILQIKNSYNNISRKLEINTNYFKMTTTNTYDVIQSWKFTNLEPNTQYTISCNLSTNLTNQNVLLFDVNWRTDITNITRTFTTDENGEYTHSMFYYAQRAVGDYIELSNIQLEKGSSATPYTPYREPIKLYNGDDITGTPDNWSIVRNFRERILNGTESWSTIATSTDYAYFYNGLLDNTAKPNNDKKRSYCNRFNWVNDMGASTNVNNNNYAITNSTYNKLRFAIDKSLLSSVDTTGFKNWLSNNNVKVVYELNTPTTEAITDTNLISQLNALYNAKSKNGQTNISVSGNLPMILEVSALKDEI